VTLRLVWNAPPLLPAHIEETIRSIARLHAEHHQNATPLQRAVDRITAFVGRPRFIGVLTLMAAGWISLNLPRSLRMALGASGRVSYNLHGRLQSG
jgi:uncharacterized membrane protein